MNWGVASWMLVETSSSVESPVALAQPLAHLANESAAHVVHGQREHFVRIRRHVSHRLQGGEVLGIGGEREAAGAAGLVEPAVEDDRSGVTHELEVGRHVGGTRGPL